MNPKKFMEFARIVGIDKAMEFVANAKNVDDTAEKAGVANKQKENSTLNREQKLEMLLSLFSEKEAEQEEVPTFDADELASKIAGAVVKGLKEAGFIAEPNEGDQKEAEKEAGDGINSKKIELLLARIEELEKSQKEAEEKSPVVSNEELERYYRGLGDQTKAQKENKNAPPQDAATSLINRMVGHNGSNK